MLRAADAMKKRSITAVIGSSTEGVGMPPRIANRGGYGGP